MYKNSTHVIKTAFLSAAHTLLAFSEAVSKVHLAVSNGVCHGHQVHLVQGVQAWHRDAHQLLAQYLGVCWSEGIGAQLCEANTVKPMIKTDGTIGPSDLHKRERWSVAMMQSCQPFCRPKCTRLFHRLKIQHFSGSLAELFLDPPHSCSVSGI